MPTAWEAVKRLFEQWCSALEKRECAGAGLDKVRARSDKVTVTPSQGGLRRLVEHPQQEQTRAKTMALGILGIQVPLHSQETIKKLF